MPKLFIWAKNSFEPTYSCNIYRIILTKWKLRHRKIKIKLNDFKIPRWNFKSCTEWYIPTIHSRKKCEDILFKQIKRHWAFCSFNSRNKKHYCGIFPQKQLREWMIYYESLAAQSISQIIKIVAMLFNQIFYENILYPTIRCTTLPSKTSIFMLLDGGTGKERLKTKRTFSKLL